MENLTEEQSKFIWDLRCNQEQSIVQVRKRFNIQYPKSQSKSGKQLVDLAKKIIFIDDERW